MKERKHNPAPSAATQTVGLPSKARLPSGAVPLIPDYHLLKVIGRGTFGTVWLAEETMAGVFRAIKVLDPPARGADVETVRGDGERAPRIDRELDGIHAYQAHTKDHPHLVRILKTGQCTLEEPCEADQNANRQGAGQPQPRNEQGAAAQINATPTVHAPRHQRRTVYYVMEIADHTGGAQPHHPVDYEPLTLATLLRQKHRLSITRVGTAAPASMRLGFFSPQRKGLFSAQRAGPCSAPAIPSASELATAHLPNGSVIDYARGLLDAIEHLHKAGLHHRDVKPSNCLFVGGILKLADVGLTTSDNHESIGTPAYMPPPEGADLTDDPDKQAETAAGAPSDLYALGKTIYQMTTGLSAGNFPDWPADLDPVVDPRLPELRKLINDLCHPDARRRLSDIREVRNGMAALASQTTSVVLSRRRIALLVSLAVALGVALGSIGLKSWCDRYDPTKRRLGQPPCDGTGKKSQYVHGNRRFVLIREHPPGETQAISNSQAMVRFFDIQTGLIQGGLVASGAYQIYNVANAVTGDIAVNDGEINQVWLIIGEGEEAEMACLYNGQPGAEPGVKSPFHHGIPLDRIAQRTESSGYIYLGYTTTPSAQIAREMYEQQGLAAIQGIRIGALSWAPTSNPPIGRGDSDPPQ